MRQKTWETKMKKFFPEYNLLLTETRTDEGVSYLLDKLNPG